MHEGCVGGGVGCSASDVCFAVTRAKVVLVVLLLHPTSRKLSSRTQQTHRHHR